MGEWDVTKEDDGVVYRRDPGPTLETIRRIVRGGVVLLSPLGAAIDPVLGSTILAIGGVVLVATAVSLASRKKNGDLIVEPRAELAVRRASAPYREASQLTLVVDGVERRGDTIDGVTVLRRLLPRVGEVWLALLVTDKRLVYVGEAGNREDALELVAPIAQILRPDDPAINLADDPTPSIMSGGVLKMTFVIVLEASAIVAASFFGMLATLSGTTFHHALGAFSSAVVVVGIDAIGSQFVGPASATLDQDYVDKVRKLLRRS